MKKNDLLWEKVKTELSTDSDIEFEIYNYYIANSRILTINENDCYVVAESRFGKVILEKMNLKIENILKNITNIKYSIKYLAEEEVNEDILNWNNAEKNAKQKINSKSTPIQIFKKFTFENFIKGESNREAYQAAYAVCLDLGNKWNPLFIYGDSGLGKTHLLHAVENKIKEIYNNKIKTKYISAEQFGKILMDIITKGHEEIESFKNSFNEYNVLLIDDIQFLSRRNKTNEIFFHILNSYIDQNKQIIITSDKYPDELNGFEQRIISRFSYGLSVGLDSPDFETALKILDIKIKNKKLKNQFSPEVLEYIAYNFNSDVRKLEGAINKLIFNAILYKKNDSNMITITDVEKAFKNVPIKKAEAMSMQNIKNVVGEHFNITVKAISGRSRVKNVVIARQVAMFLARTLLDKSFNSIGIEFSNKDHTTVMNAVRKIENLIKNDKEFKKQIGNIKNKLK